MPSCLRRWRLPCPGSAFPPSTPRLGPRERERRRIWAYAASRRMMIVTKDEDVARRRLSGRAGPQIVWIRLANLRRQAPVDGIMPTPPSLVAALERGEPVVVLSPDIARPFA